MHQRPNHLVELRVGQVVDRSVFLAFQNCLVLQNKRHGQEQRKLSCQS